ncbi:MAG: Crp/Fnr family transcriptional regulator [Planctomycetia bacterium]|nr:Crp/Fnr family transcriptional regulator [Planctomycetia bacterium]
MAPSPRQRRNQLLGAMPAPVVRRLEQHLHPVELKTRDVIYEPGDRLRHVLFPQSGVISIVNVMQDGRSIEVGTIGHEGMTGVTALSGVDFVPYRCVVQIPGTALRIQRADFIKLVGRDPQVQHLILRYYIAFTSQLMQSAACLGLHSVEQRCCRWLLSTDDRVESNAFSLSHEFLALMLGTRRTSVSLVMKQLRDCGFIEYHRGTITIIDRAGLAARSCECYGVVAETFRRFMGTQAG